MVTALDQTCDKLQELEAGVCLEQSVALAVMDALTGLHNRRSMDRHFAAIAEQA